MSFSITTVLNYQKATGGGNPNPEMLADGAFAEAGTHWGSSGVVITTGLVTYDAVQMYSLIGQYEDNGMTSLEANTIYELKFDVTSPGNLDLNFTNYSQSNVFIDYTFYTTGSYSLEFTTPADVSINGFRVGFTTQNEGVGGTLANLSVKEKP
jgi:hypothetical protein